MGKEKVWFGPQFSLFKWVVPPLWRGSFVKGCCAARLPTTREYRETLLLWTQQSRDVWDFANDKMVAEQEMKGLASQAEDFGAQDCSDIPRRWRLVRGLLRESWFKGSSDS